MANKIYATKDYNEYNLRIEIDNMFAQVSIKMDDDFSTVIRQLDHLKTILISNHKYLTEKL